jgi:hypothetical protein
MPIFRAPHTHLAPTTAGISVAFRVFGHGTTGWPIRSQGHGRQPSIGLETELSITKVTLALAPNSSILNKPHPLPLILARQPVSRQPLPQSTLYCPAIVTDELPQNKITVSNFKMVIYRYPPSRYDLPWIEPRVKEHRFEATK